MVPPDSTGIPRVPAYSGISSIRLHAFRVRDSHPLRSAVPDAFHYALRQTGKPRTDPATPAGRKSNRFGLLPFRSPLLRESHVDFSSSGYLDVSVPRVGLSLRRRRDTTPARLPHSDTPGSMLACSSPRLFAACHVLHRRSVPRHPPCALSRLTSSLLLGLTV